jgi:hypothetical protein
MVIAFLFSTPMVAYELGRMVLSFSGVPEGSSPTALFRDLSEDEDFAADGINLLRMPVTVSAIHTTVNKSEGNWP